jgi:hypothetical protein
MKTLLLLLALCVPLSAQLPNENVGRYQIFQQVDGLYAFDTQTGVVYFLKLVRGGVLAPNKLIWVRLSKPISEAVEPENVSR